MCSYNTTISMLHYTYLIIILYVFINLSFNFDLNFPYHYHVLSIRKKLCHIRVWSLLYQDDNDLTSRIVSSSLSLISLLLIYALLNQLIRHFWILKSACRLWRMMLLICSLWICCWQVILLMISKKLSLLLISSH